jgi:hypothetical protein
MRCKKAFKELKRRIIIALILYIFNIKKEVIVEIDALDKVIKG